MQNTDMQKKRKENITGREKKYEIGEKSLRHILGMRGSKR